MDDNVKIEDIATATRASARMRQKAEREIMAGTLTPERYAQLYADLQEEIDGLQLPHYWNTMLWKAHMWNATFFDHFVQSTRESLEKRGIITDEEITEIVRERVGGLY